MSLPPGTRIGHYEIVAPLGAGGMGEVFRATDSRLGREVAIKVLPASFANDPDRLARFEREARALAALNHPNIAQVYGFEEFTTTGGATRALVMELLDGESLRDRLVSAGPTGMPVRKAVEAAGQIARGLSAAHERGIIHRDLKPENVFVLRDGQVKILDFGLARAAAGSASAAADAATRFAPATDPGTVMGTVGYMAPEQVRGADVDARADLFAFGCVLYEMLTGQRAFRRDTPAETMTAILHEDPADVTAARADLTPSLERIVRHCLEKNPHERFQTARDVAFALSALSGSASAPALAIPARRASRAALAWAALSAVLAGIVLWQGVAVRREPPVAPAAVTYRVSVPLPDGFHDADSTFPGLKLSVSPDGRRVVVRGTTSGARNQLWVGSLVDGTFRAMADTETGLAPSWSPDGTRIAFFDRQQLRVIDAEGGSSTVVGDRGFAAWGADDVLLVARLGTSLFRTSASGGPYRAVHERKGSEFFGIPWFLDDGRRYIYALSDREHPDTDGIYRASLDGAPPVRILTSTDHLNVAYANGALLHVRGAALMAQPLDIATGQTTGAAVTIANDVDAAGFRGAAFSASRTGTLVYLPSATGSVSRLTWMNRRGEPLSTVADDADYNSLQLSRDGRRLTVSVTDPSARTRDIYLVDLARGVRQRLTFDASDERTAVWSPDGRSVVYNAKGLDFYTRSSDFTGNESAVLVDGRSKDPTDISSDGRYLLYRRSGEGTGNDIWIVALDGDRTPRLLAGTPFEENSASFSPDGQAVVYASDESGDSEIYVTRIDGAGGKMLVSSGGGSFPRWRRDGREILYLGPDNTIMSVPLTGDGVAMQAGSPRALFQVRPQPGPSSPFDVTADGERFLVNVALPSRTPLALRMIVNWPALLGTAK